MADKLLGVDFGAARTGLAVSDDLGMYAHGIGNVKSYNADKAAAEIAAKAKELGISLIVVGKPVNMDGSLGEKAQACIAFADKIAQCGNIPVTLYDERCTTVIAHTYLRESGIKTKNHRATVDSLAAEIILQDYMDMTKSKKSKDTEDKKI